MSDLLARASDPTALRLAWKDVRKRNGCAGLDGVSLPVFERGLERRLWRLSEDLRSGSYRAYPLRGITIPKATGEPRHLAVPTVRDRIAQRAILTEILPRFESIFLPCSFAYRPGRSVRMAVSWIDAQRQKGYGWVAHVDVKDCFDSLNRDFTFKLVAAVVREKDVLRLLEQWASAPVVERGFARTRETGIPQGDVVSPLLCNVVLDRFDHAMAARKTPMVRYADDILLFARTREEAEALLPMAETVLGQLGLCMNEAKSRVESFEAGFRYLGTLFVCTMVLPCIRIEGADGKVRYTSGYEAPRKRGPKALRITRGKRTIVASSDRLTAEEIERRLNQAAADELLGRRTTAVGRALIAAWRKELAKAVSSPSPPAAGRVMVID